MNPDFKKQLMQAFALGDEALVDGFIEKLRTGAGVDADALRKGFLALVDNAREAPAAHVETRMRVALKASDLGFWEWDLTTGNIFVDRTYFGFLGFDRDDQVMPITDLMGLVSPDDLQAFRDAIADAVRGKSPLFQVQHRVRHADGRWVWIETSGGVCCRDASGRVLRMTGTNSNITERKQLSAPCPTRCACCARCSKPCRCP